MICRHTTSFKIWISKVQDFGNFELSPMQSGLEKSTRLLASKARMSRNFDWFYLKILNMNTYIMSM